MKEYLLAYRMDYSNMPAATQEQKDAMTKRWMDWMTGIATAGFLVDRGNRLETTGMVVRPGNVVTNGPYAEIKESIGGYSMVRAASYEDAVALAKGCPIFIMGGCVEVREVANLQA